MCLCRCVPMCVCLSVSRGTMQSRDANFIICSEGWWQMVLWDACKTSVSEAARERQALWPFD